MPEKPTSFVVTKIPTNFVYPDIRPEDYRFGSGQLVGTPLRADGDWRDYLPPEEDQNVRGIESSACYVEASQHTIATIEEEQLREKDNNYSARFNALLSGGSQSGGNPIAGGDSMRNDGLISDSLMPFGDSILSWDDFHSWKGVIESAVRAIGKQYLGGKILGYDIVCEKWEPVADKYAKLKKSLQYSPCPVSVTGWYEHDGIYYKPDGMNDNHLVELVYIDEFNQPYIRDTYSPYLKKLEANFNFDFAMRWSVEKRAAPPQSDTVTLTPYQQFLALFIKLRDYLITNPQPMPPTPPTVPQNPPKPPTPTIPAYLWDNFANARHSVRVICDQMGLKLNEKNLITAVIQAESGFMNSAVRRNYRRDGTLSSTDWGLCQVNDFYHVGPGKKWSSVKQILDNPDKVVKWMIALYRQGQLKLWVAYSSGAYLKYMAKTLGSEGDLQTNQTTMIDSQFISAFVIVLAFFLPLVGIKLPTDQLTQIIQAVAILISSGVVVYQRTTLQKAPNGIGDVSNFGMAVK